VTWAPPYADAADLRAYMRVAAVDDMDAADVLEDTTVYSPAIEAASRVIDNSAGRQFGSSDPDTPAVEDRDYVAWYSPHADAWYIDIDDLMDDTDLVVMADTTDITADVTLLPLNNAAKGRPWTLMEIPSAYSAITITVSAHWGWSAIPDTIVTATLLQASRFVKRRDAPFGVAGSPDMGNELRLLAKIDPDVEVLIRSYRRYW